MGQRSWDPNWSLSAPKSVAPDGAVSLPQVNLAANLPSCEKKCPGGFWRGCMRGVGVDKDHSVPMMASTY